MNPQAEIYEFPGAEELVMTPEPEEIEEIEEAAPPVEARTPVDYAKLQAAAILQDANNQAEELLEHTRTEAEAELAELRETARSEGYQTGYAEGMAAAMMAGKTERERQTVEAARRIQQFLEKAAQAEDDLLDSTRDELRDLAIAVAEKVVRVSL
ncbi:MAG: F0F1 ATP synthase subunit delta, partial [Oscillospiraceae bacterium]